MTPPPAKARVRRHRRPLVEELIDAARARDRATFDRLFDLWFDAVLAGARRQLDDRAVAHERTGRLLRSALVARLAARGAGEAAAGASGNDPAVTGASLEAPGSERR